MDEAKSQPWYQLYAAAVVELDAKQLIERVSAIEAAIHGRLRDCSTTANIMKSADLWKTRNAPWGSCVAVHKRCGAISESVQF
jgi:hypothetical protein